MHRQIQTQRPWITQHGPSLHHSKQCRRSKRLRTQTNISIVGKNHKSYCNDPVRSRAWRYCSKPFPHSLSRSLCPSSSFSSLARARHATKQDRPKSTSARHGQNPAVCIAKRSPECQVIPTGLSSCLSISPLLLCRGVAKAPLHLGGKQGKHYSPIGYLCKRRAASKWRWRKQDDEKLKRRSASACIDFDEGVGICTWTTLAVPRHFKLRTPCLPDRNENESPRFASSWGWH